MPDRCEVLPGDSVVARRGGGLLWVDAPGSPALVAALHACLGVSGPGADRVLSAVAGQVSSLAHGAAYGSALPTMWPTRCPRKPPLPTGTCTMSVPVFTEAAAAALRRAITRPRS